MATKKKLLQAAAGTAAASGVAGALSVEDVFSTYLYEGNGSSQAIENGINLGQSNDGTSVVMNLYTSADSLTSSDDTDSLFINDNNIIDFGTGDFTFECWLWAKDYGASTYNDIAGGDSSEFGLGIYAGTLYYSRNGVVNPLQADVTSKLNQWMHIAVSRSSGTSKLFVDGVEEQSTSDTNSFASANGVHIGRLGTRTYRHQGYISNVRIVKGTGIYTSAFTPPTSELTAVSGTTLLLCNGENPLEDASSNSHSITKQGNPKASTFGPFDAAEAGEGGLVWIKSRSQAFDHVLSDTERGATKYLSSNTTNSNYTSSNALSSFNANGFSIGSTGDFNYSGDDFASWTFRKAPKFFTCLTYSGNGSTQTISHDLGAVPACIIVKRTDTSGYAWVVYHQGADATAPEQYYLNLNNTNARAAASNKWNNTAPTSTDFYLGNAGDTNASGGTYVAYLFAHNDGDGGFGSEADQDIIKCGSYTGNGSSTGPEIDLGFEPQWVMIKRTDTSIADSWAIHDTMRGIVSGGNDPYLLASSSNSENSIGIIDVTPTGFKLTSTYGGWNASSGTYIYIAIRRGPMAVPTDATDVFQPYVTSSISSSGSTTSSSSYDVGFPVDLLIQKNKDGTDGWYAGTRLTGDKYLKTESTAVEASSAGIWWDSNISAWNYASTYGTYNWKRAPSYFDAVAYTGNGTAGRTVPHGLTVPPEMMWVKRRDTTQDWKVYHTGLTSAAYYLDLNSSSGEAVSSVWASTDPTSSVFSVGSNNSVNASGGTYIAYLFASLDGVSKLGSINHTSGVDTNVDCGFSNGARFVLWKQTDAANSWGVVDVERGLVSGNDALLLLNSTNAETSVYDLIDPLSSGFVFTGAFGTGSYIFYAIA